MRLALLSIALLVLACGCPHKYPKPAHEPSADELVNHLAEVRAAVHSFKTVETKMDYWIGDDRFRGTVYLMGELGAKVRMNALRPDGDVAADLACNGSDFVYEDHLNNCQLTGPCNSRSIAALVRVPLEPDDFLFLALGATPVIDGKGAVSWDAKHGHWRLELAGSDGRQQTIEVDDHDGKGVWDLVHSEVRGSDGKPLWTVDHQSYRVAKDADGVDHRVPGKSHVTTPAEKSDLIVEWGGDLEVNLSLPPEAWALEADPAIATCGQKR
jgi:hypothetical protein